VKTQHYITAPSPKSGLFPQRLLLLLLLPLLLLLLIWGHIGTEKTIGAQGGSKKEVEECGRTWDEPLHTNPSPD